MPAVTTASASVLQGLGSLIVSQHAPWRSVSSSEGMARGAASSVDCVTPPGGNPGTLAAAAHGRAQSIKGKSLRAKEHSCSMHRVSPLSLSMLLARRQVCCPASGDAQALGFGRSVSASHLGQPLNFVSHGAPLESDESLPRECVTAEVLGDFRVAARRRARLGRAGAETRRALVRVTTTTAIDRPVVTVTVRPAASRCLSRAS